METPTINNPDALQATEAEVSAEVSDTIPATQDPADLSRLLDEAEQRGYLRGRNEAITEQISRPGLWEEPDTSSRVTILDNLRPGIWD